MGDEKLLLVVLSDFHVPRPAKDSSDQPCVVHFFSGVVPYCAKSV